MVVSLRCNSGPLLLLLGRLEQLHPSFVGMSSFCKQYHSDYWRQVILRSIMYPVISWYVFCSSSLSCPLSLFSVVFLDDGCIHRFTFFHVEPIKNWRDVFLRIASSPYVSLRLMASPNRLLDSLRSLILKYCWISCFLLCSSCRLADVTSQLST